MKLRYSLRPRTTRGGRVGNPGGARALRPCLEVLEDRVTPSFLLPGSAGRRDLVYDPTRDRLYVLTSSGRVLRYDVAAPVPTGLTPWDLGASQADADITPNGAFLYVTGLALDTPQGTLHKVNLFNGSVTPVTYLLEPNEIGPAEIAFASNGKALLTSHVRSGYRGAVRELDLATDTVSIFSPLRLFYQPAPIARSADGSLLLVPETGISPGQFFTYDGAGGTVLRVITSYQTGANQPFAINRDGSLVAMSLGAIAVMDRDLRAVVNLSGVTGSLAFDPSRDVLYAADASSDHVIAFDIATRVELFRVPVGEDIGLYTAHDSSLMAVNATGSRLFLSTPAGVRVLDLPSGPGPAVQLRIGGLPALLPEGGAGTFTVTARDGFGQIATGFRGTVTFASSDPRAVLPASYAFTAEDAGVHTFPATLHTAGIHSITVRPAGAGPAAATQGDITVHAGRINLLPVADPRDHVLDAARAVLYFTTAGGFVERYDLASQTLLPPWKVGLSLNGADLTPDGRFLYAAENTRSLTQGFLHKVDLATGRVTDLVYDLNPTGGLLEGGGWDVGIGPAGKGLVSARLEGSGGTALRQLDLATDALSVRLDVPGTAPSGRVMQDAHIARARDRSFFLVTESNLSSGPLFTYDPAADVFPDRKLSFVFYNESLSAVNRDGTLLATELQFGVGAAFYYGVSVMDRNLGSVFSLPPNFDGGIAFDPTRDLLYAIDSTVDRVVAFDTATGRERFRFAVGEDLGFSRALGSGLMTVTDDGRRIFLSTPSGVRVLDLPANPGVAVQLELAGFPLHLAPGVPGTFTLTVRDALGNPVPSFRGRVGFTSSDPAAVLPAPYTFTAEDAGRHTFPATLNTPGGQVLRVVTPPPDPLTATHPPITVHDRRFPLIPLPGRRDHVYDPGRGLLYITTGDGNLYRYDAANQTLLAPWKVGSSLRGADISPDGSFLYVTEGLRGATQAFLRKVNLTDGTVTNLTYDLADLESGSWDIAIASNGKALFDGAFEGGGSVPVRQLDLATGALSRRADAGGVRMNTSIVRGADRSLLFFLEPGVSSGLLRTYAAAGDRFSPPLDTRTTYVNALSAVNRNGTLVAHELEIDIRVRDAALKVLRTLPGLDGGLAFDPVRDLLYAVSSFTDQIVALDTNTWAERFRIPIGENVGASEFFGSGVMTVNDDGQLLFLSTGSGVRVYRLGVGAPALAVGSGAGGAPRVRVLDGATRGERFNFLAYGGGFTGGVRVAVGDFTGDRIPDVAVAPGPGAALPVRVYDGASTGAVPVAPLTLTPFPGFTGGLFVAAGDLTSDGRADLVVSPDAGPLPGGATAPPLVAFNGASGALLGAGWPYGPDFTGGVRTALADVDGDRKADLITAPGLGRPADVLVVSGADGSLLRRFRAYDAAFTGGAFVTAADFTRDGKADLIVAPDGGYWPGAGAAPPLLVFDGATGVLLGLGWCFDPAFSGGVRVALADVNGDGAADLVAAPGPGMGTLVRLFDLLAGAELAQLDPFGPSFTQGAFIAAG